jgi:hypothetical protein
MDHLNSYGLFLIPLALRKAPPNMTLNAISGVLPTECGRELKLDRLSQTVGTISLPAHDYADARRQAQRRLVFSEYFRLQLGEMIGKGLLVDFLGDFLVAG